MDYKRAFCFGDSYTYYAWPTWADILEKDLDIPVQNWGLQGLGNIGIFCRMIQCDIINKFTNDDLIIVLWSSWTREDRYIEGRWTGYGNIFAHNKDSLYDSNFIKKHWDWSNDIIKNSTAIISANKMFNIFDNFSFIPMNSPEDIIIDKGNWTENEMIKFYVKDFPDIKYFGDYDSKIKDLTDDPHQDIIAHSNFVKNEIYSKLGITMKSTTEKDVQSYQDAYLHELLKKAVEGFKNVEEIEKNPELDVGTKSGKLPIYDRDNIASLLWESNNWKKVDEHDWWSK